MTKNSAERMAKPMAILKKLGSDFMGVSLSKTRPTGGGYIGRHATTHFSPAREIASSRFFLKQHQRWTLNQLPEFGQILSADGAIDHAMVGAEADRHALARNDRVIRSDDRLLHDCPDGND
jgi:hypothetical protein